MANSNPLTELLCSPHCRPVFPFGNIQLQNLVTAFTHRVTLGLEGAGCDAGDLPAM